MTLAVRERHDHGPTVVSSGMRRGAAVLGSPIAHSLSPVLHLAAYEELGYSDWTYEAVECTEDELPSILRSLELRGLAGASLTMPLKRAVMPLLARTDRVAADVGAANTVLFGGVEGDWYGANTDVPGIVAALRAEGITSAGSAMVLGGGATAASAFAALAPLGAQVTVYVRRPDAAAGLAEVATRLGVPAPDIQPWDLAAPRLGEAELVVSTTPAGATDALVTDLPGRVPGALFDVVYAPWPTVLAAAWSARGGLVIGGLDLLVEQAALQVELMTGHMPDIGIMRTAAASALSG
jgi:shikimate dehydrogenase